jgi:hypothetical protein
MLAFLLLLARIVADAVPGVTWVHYVAELMMVS